jgi:hypothetical protein
VTATRPRARRAAAVGFAALGALAGPARAGDPRVESVETVDQPEPGLRVIVAADEPGYRAEEFRLIVDPGTAREVRVAARSAAPAPAEGIHVVVVIQATPDFLGADAAAPREELMRSVMALGSGLPDGAELGVITYAGDAVVRAPLAPPGELPPGALGSPDEHRDKSTGGFSEAVGQALDRLEDRRGRRVVLVIADGAVPDLKSLRRRAVAAGVEVHTIGIRPGDAPDRGGGLSRLAHPGRASWCGTLAELGDRVMLTRDWILGVYQVEFPTSGLPFDGKHHELQVEVKGTASPIKEVLLQRVATRPAGWWTGRRPALVIAGVLLFTITVVMLWLWVRRGRVARAVPTPRVDPQPEPQPTPIIKEEDVRPRPPAEDTDLIAPGLAAWLVPLNGSLQLRTFPLPRMGEFFIGTGFNCELRLTDGAVRPRHARIKARRGRFVITAVDASTEAGAVYLSAQTLRPLQGSHELHNDIFVLGRTEFRFKSTQDQVERPPP